MTNKNSKIISSIKKELSIIIDYLYKNGLCLEYQDYSINNIGNDSIEITRPNRRNESNVLYDEIISLKYITKTLLDGKEFNILLNDKSIIQFEFECVDGRIKKERFIYVRPFNHIDFLSEEYDDFDWFEIDDGIPIVIRVDYDEKDIPNHPKSHATLNNIEYCRIPLKGPISVTSFISFILSMFYGLSYNGEVFDYANYETITEEEKKQVHLNWEC